MQITSRISLTKAIESFIADKPLLARQYEKFEQPEEEIWVYSALAREVFIDGHVKDEQTDIND